MKSFLGTHIIADFYGVHFDLIDSVEDVKNLLESTVEKANLTKISSSYYQFEPYGASGVVLLAESHLSIHTWPELGIALVDVFTCGLPKQAFDAINYIEEVLKPKKVVKKAFSRG